MGRGTVRRELFGLWSKSRLQTSVTELAALDLTELGHQNRSVPSFKVGRLVGRGEQFCGELIGYNDLHAMSAAPHCRLTAQPCTVAILPRTCLTLRR